MVLHIYRIMFIIFFLRTLWKFFPVKINHIKMQFMKIAINVQL